EAPRVVLTLKWSSPVCDRTAAINFSWSATSLAGRTVRPEKTPSATAPRKTTTVSISPRAAITTAHRRGKRPPPAGPHSRGRYLSPQAGFRRRQKALHQQLEAEREAPGLCPEPRCNQSF